MTCLTFVNSVDVDLFDWDISYHWWTSSLLSSNRGHIELLIWSHLCYFANGCYRWLTSNLSITTSCMFIMMCIFSLKSFFIKEFEQSIVSLRVKIILLFFDLLLNLHFLFNSILKVVINFLPPFLPPIEIIFILLLTLLSHPFGVPLTLFNIFGYKRSRWLIHNLLRHSVDLIDVTTSNSIINIISCAGKLACLMGMIGYVAIWCKIHWFYFLKCIFTIALWYMGLYWMANGWTFVICISIW